VIDKIRPYFNHPGFIEPFADAARAALGEVPDGSRLVFTAHSVPVGMAATSGSLTAGTASAAPGGRYAAELAEAARLVAERALSYPPDPSRASPFDLVYQSRSGSPSVPWLEPDICDHLAVLAKEGVPGVVVVPVGFTSDHMEIVQDLDVAAAQTAAGLGIRFARAGTPMADPRSAGPGGRPPVDPRFAAMVTDLVLERMGAAEPASLGGFGPAAGDCPADCCRYQPGRRPA
jgi:ferrochelatase